MVSYDNPPEQSLPYAWVLEFTATIMEPTSWMRLNPFAAQLEGSEFSNTLPHQHLTHF